MGRNPPPTTDNKTVDSITVETPRSVWRAITTGLVVAHQEWPVAKRSKKSPDATVQGIIAAIHGGRFTDTELTLLNSLVDEHKKRAAAEVRLLSAAKALGQAHSKLLVQTAQHAPKKRGRPRQPANRVSPLELKHFAVLERLVEAEGHGLMLGDFQVAGVTGKTLQRVLTDLRDKFLVDLKGKRWHWTPNGERLNTGQ